MLAVNKNTVVKTKLWYMQNQIRKLKKGWIQLQLELHLLNNQFGDEIGEQSIILRFRGW